MGPKKALAGSPRRSPKEQNENTCLFRSVSNLRHIYLPLLPEEKRPPAHSCNIYIPHIEQRHAYERFVNADFPSAWNSWFVVKIKNLLDVTNADTLSDFDWVPFLVNILFCQVMPR